MREKNREERESEGPGDGAPRPSHRQSRGGGGEGPQRSRTAPGARGRGGLVARPDRPAPERSENLTCPEDRPSEGSRHVGSSVRSRGTEEHSSPRRGAASLGPRVGGRRGRSRQAGRVWGSPPGELLRDDLSPNEGRRRGSEGWLPAVGAPPPERWEEGEVSAACGLGVRPPPPVPRPGS